MMKRYPIVVILVLCALFPAYSLDISTGFHIGNLNFAQDRGVAETTLPAIFPWGVGISVHQAIDEQVGLDIGFNDDPTLRFVVHTLLDYRVSYFTLSVGPFFGVLNSTNSVLKPGISTGVRIEFPSIAFISFRADSSLGARLVSPGDYLQERSDVAVGFYTPNAIAALNLVTRSFVRRTDTLEIVDSYLKYSFSTDLFQKNVPYRVLLDFGYQERGMSFINVTSRASTDHILRSIVVGTKITVELTRQLTGELSVDSSIYSFGSAGSAILTVPTTGIEQYLFNASIGARISLD